MKLRMQAFSALVAGTMAIALAVPAANALNKEQGKCQATIAKSGGKFMKAWLKERAKCADKNLKATDSCDFVKRDAKLAKAETKLKEGLSKKCGDAVFGASFTSANLKTLGFPGKCPDADPSDGFTETDLTDCIFLTHKETAEKLLDLEYGSNADDAVLSFDDPSRDPANAKALGKCQKEIGKNGIKLIKTVQKEISKCRDGLIKGKLNGFLPVDCATTLLNPKPGLKIAKTSSKAKVKIADKCADPLLTSTAMDVCDTGSGPQTDATAAATCVADSHVQAADDPDNTGLASPFPTDLIDIEYALAAACGDNIINDPLQAVLGSTKVGEPPEECDGTDDSACPGLCGAPTGNFPCLCTDTPRERVIEHDTSDLDNGWTGTSHDSTVVEGGGYVADLHDCDGPGGPDTLCTVGPSCNNTPHQSCISDATCGGSGNFCRRSGIEVGPHCNEDIKLACTSDADCKSPSGPNSPNDFCRKTPHGIPLPLSSGGVAVCVVNVFSEDVVGTTDLATGSSAVRLREDSVTHIASGTLNQPCPVCGGFCSGASGGAGPGDRTLCAVDSDCPASSTCITDKICSYGPNEDKACRATGIFGDLTVLFGTPSVDCPPSPGQNISGGGLDILFNPSTTGTVFTPPSQSCSSATFDSNRKCILGSEVGKACAADGDCAGGGAGSCALQCFCPSLLGRQQQPNLCSPACHGGTNDYLPCPSTKASQVCGGTCEGGTNASESCTLSSTCPDQGSFLVCLGGTNSSEPCPNGITDCPDQSAGTSCVGKFCFGGTNNGESCSTLSNCPDQSTGTACLAPCQLGDCVNDVCVGGDRDGLLCCPGGLCEQASCRVAAGVCTGGSLPAGTTCSVDTDCGTSGLCGDPDSSGEGFCAGGPAIGLCSFTTLKGCALDSECRPSGDCAFCKPDNSETCIFKNRDCFPSAGYTRTGAIGVPDRVLVSSYCLPAATDASVNNTAGLPGPGALEEPVTVIDTGF